MIIIIMKLNVTCKDKELFLDFLRIIVRFFKTIYITAQSSFLKTTYFFHRLVPIFDINNRTYVKIYLISLLTRCSCELLFENFLMFP